MPSKIRKVLIPELGPIVIGLVPVSEVMEGLVPSACSLMFCCLVPASGIRRG